MSQIESRPGAGPHPARRPPRAALVTAHPGHELCVLGWLKQTRPHVFLLTDGSGRDAPPRLTETTELLRRAGARPGSVYGRHTDADVYRALLGGDTDFFVSVAAELAAAFARERFEYVACEAAEGYNPTHDLCRLLAAAAVARANRDGGGRTALYEFSLIRRGRAADGGGVDDDGGEGGGLRLRLDDEALGEKLSTMRAHPHLREEVSAGLDGAGLAAVAGHPELEAELRTLVAGMGPEAFRFEVLRGVTSVEPPEPAGATFYERYADMLVRRGRYASAVRYAAHVRPVRERLRRFAEGG